MIEREIITQKMKEFQIQEFVAESLRGVGLSHVKIQRTPLGEKIVIFASRPGLIIGGGGSNIKKLTKNLKKKFDLENPQIEISEVANVNLISQVVAERIASSLEKFGSMRFKGIGHKSMTDVMTSGARGVEIIISGKIPSARAKKWRFYQGYLKKCGDFAISVVDTAYANAKLKTGIVGIKVSIMPPNTRLPDDVRIITPSEPTVEEIKDKEEKDKIEKELKEHTVKKETKKRAPAKKKKKESKDEK
ncbi:MAG: 30S ribosomal protein S3 [archaeon]